MSEERSNKSLVNFLLNGDNYLTWARAMKVALGGQKKIQHIKGRSVTEEELPTEATPADKLKAQAAKKKEDEEWEANDLQVMSQILNSIEPKLYGIFAYANTSKELWDTIYDMYGDANNSSRIFEIQQTISSLKQGQDQSFLEHFGVFKQNWEELRQYRPTATTIAEYITREQQDQIFYLLASLTADYEEVKRDILMRSELPSLNAVCAIIQREETRKRVMGSKVNTSSPTLENFAHFSSAKTQDSNQVYRGKDKRKFYCDHCNKNGHTKDRCWVLHPNLKPNRNKSGEAHQVVATGSEGVHKALEQLTKQMDFLMKRCVPDGETGTASKGESNPATTAFAGKILALSANVTDNSVHSKIVVDSGATDNMFSSSKLLTKFQPNTDYSHVTVANGGIIHAKGSGIARIFSKDINVTVVPDLKANLLSISKCTNQLGCNVIFTPQRVVFQDRSSGKTIGEGSLKDGLYVLESNQMALSTQDTSNSELWHKRLGHPSTLVLKNLNLPFAHDFNNCEPCQFAKMHRLPFPEHSDKYNDIFDLVHSDVWGNAPVTSKEGFKYFVTFIDDKSRATWLYLLKSKTEVFEKYQSFCKMVETQFEKKVKILRTDNGTEYVNHTFRNFLLENGTLHQTSCVGTPQQNGVSERKNRHLLEVTRALLFSAHLPNHYWADAILTGCYLINRLPSHILEFQSPVEILYNRKFNLSHLRTFGCVCYVHTQKAGKLDHHAQKCVFVGYSSSQKGYKCYNPPSGRMYVSRDVRFVEEEMFYKTEVQENIMVYKDFQVAAQSPSLPVNATSDTRGDNMIDDCNPSSSRDSSEHTSDESSADASSTEESHIQSESSALEGGEIPNDTPAEDSVSHGTEPTVETRDERPPPRRTTRAAKLPAKLQDFEIYHATSYPIQETVRYDKVSSQFYTFLTQIDKVSEPNSFEEAKQDPNWISAMKEELNALNRNQTWDLVRLPNGKRTVGCRWIYKVKYKSDGTLERYKARLVAKGYTQTYGLDYSETFAPVAKMNTIRTLLSIATNCDWPLFQMDVRNAFLQGDLEEEVYMDLPPGLPRESGLVCKLKKAIYGLKQSPRAWYGKLSSTLVKIGYKKCVADSSLFVKQSDKGIIVILIYVDDLVITGSDLRGLEELKQHLGRKFDIKDLGNLKYFLGIEIARSNKGLFLSQRKYVLELLKETGKLAVKPAYIPMDISQKILVDDKQIEDIGMFQRLVGKLIYLTITRPDISYAVSYVSQFMYKPMEGHLEIVNQILRYLKSAPGRGILMQKHGHLNIVGYTDADWAGCPYGRKSTTGFCMFVGGNAVTWRSKKQAVVAKSSAEAEYRAMSAATSEIIWLRTLLQELGYRVGDKPSVLFCDSQAAMHIASNPVFHERTKHIEVDCHFVREKVLNKTIQTGYIRSANQIADIFTKPLGKRQFEELKGKLTSDELYGST
jgi:Reverse transcriptase (RNA-dependent DNA polymerase)/Integrase core domain/gag-polypeptide of LTR copia-type/GAG-pre-integrase domain